MPSTLMLEGFMITPIGHLVDFESSTVEPVPLGERKVKLADMQKFLDEEWPELWTSLKQQMADMVKHREAAALAAQLEESAPRRDRRAATKKVGKKVAAKKTVPSEVDS